MLAIEADDKGDTDSTGALGGDETQLLSLFRAMWHDKKIGRFMKTVAFYESVKAALNDGRK